jgi:hypothetical protein
MSKINKNKDRSDQMDSCYQLLDKIESDNHNFRIKNLKQNKITDVCLIIDLMSFSYQLANTIKLSKNIITNNMV